MQAHQQTVYAIGECMIELQRSVTLDGAMDYRFGGDTLNAAVYMARLVDPAVEAADVLGNTAAEQVIVLHDGCKSMAMTAVVLQSAPVEEYVAPGG